MIQRLLQSGTGKLLLVIEGIIFAAQWVDWIDVWVKIVSGIAAVVVAVFTVWHYWTKIRNNNIDSRIKMLELEKKEQEWWEEQERKKALK